MSVNPVTSTTWWGSAKKGGESETTASAGFQEILAKSGAPTGAAGQARDRVTVATAAELLRLKLLGSALDIGAPAEQSTPSKTGVQALLDKFLAQIPEKSSSAATGSNSAADGPVSGVGTEALASEPDLAAEPVLAAASEVLADTAPTEAIIEKASRRYGVDAGLIKAVIKAESNFNPRAVSSAGAQGLMQLMPATARGLGVSDPFDPEQNVMAGTRFLKDMLRRYDGNVDEALAAYNWGPGNVDRHGTGSLPRETRTYLGKVKGYYAQYVG